MEHQEGVRVLCLTAAPLIDEDGRPVPPLDVEGERSALRSVFSTADVAGVLRFGVATTNELFGAAAERYTILVLSGHGHPDFLVLEDGRGGTQRVGGGALRDMARMCGTLRVAVVAACHSEGLAHFLVAGGVPHVVAIREAEPVLDAASILFLREFFKCLVAGRSVSFAFQVAKLVVKNDPFITTLRQTPEGAGGREEHEKFVLLPDGPSSAVHEEVPLRGGPGRLAEDTPAIPHNVRLGEAIILGRSAESHRAIQHLLDGSIVTILGAPGIGKSSVAKNIARWCLDRGRFPGGVFFVNLRGASTQEEILATVRASVQPTTGTQDALVSPPAGPPVLLILDNLEGAVANDPVGTRAAVSELAAKLPRCAILGTSQRPVGGVLPRAEKEVRIGPVAPDVARLVFARASPRPLASSEVDSPEFEWIMDALGGHPLSTVVLARGLREHISLSTLAESLRREGGSALVAPGSGGAEEGSLSACLRLALNGCTAEAEFVMLELSFMPSGVDLDISPDVFELERRKLGQVVSDLIDRGLVESFRKLNRVFVLPPIALFVRSKAPQRAVHRACSLALKHFAQLGYAIATTWEKDGGRAARGLFEVELPNFLAAMDFDMSGADAGATEAFLFVVGSTLLHADAVHLARRFAETLDRLHPATSSSLNLSGQVAEREGRWTDFEALLRRRVDVDGGISEAFASWELVDLLMDQGRLREAADVLRQVSLRDRPRDAWNYATAAADLAWLSRGRVAPLTTREIRQIVESLGMASWDNLADRGSCSAFLGVLLLFEGDIEQGRGLLESAYTMFGQSGSVRQRARTDAKLALADMCMRDWGKASERMARLEGFAVQSNNWSLRALAATLRALGQVYTDMLGPPADPEPLATLVARGSSQLAWLRWLEFLTTRLGPPEPGQRQERLANLRALVSGHVGEPEWVV